LSDDLVTSGELPFPAPGSTVGPWLLLQRVDSGSYGVVFLARRAGHPDSPPVAVKMARQPMDPRFEREGQLLQLMHHLGIPRYEDSGVWTSPLGHRYPYVVMECIRGFTLYDWFRDQPRSSREVLRVLAQVARGLEEVHARGAVHRDVKGDNIRVTPEGRAVLLDFGSGWLAGARPLTDTTVPPGTTAYRPPEMRRFMWKFRKDAEARWHSRAADDLYSLGVAAYRLVTGTYLPPVTDTEDDEPRKVLRPREVATVGLELESIILRLLSEDRQERGTATEIAEALEQAAQRAGPAADDPILPTPAAALTEKGAPQFSSDPGGSSEPDRQRSSDAPKRQTPSTTFPIWLSWASAALVGGAVVALTMELRGPRLPEADSWSMHEERHVPYRETPDAGVGEEALLSAEPTSRPLSPAYVVSLPMPKDPFPGQKKPPCSPRFEREALGACWIVLEAKPPCEREGYEYDGKCVRASFHAPRPPASGEP
jgi:serine/threonine protein kinase